MHFIFQQRCAQLGACVQFEKAERLVEQEGLHFQFSSNYKHTLYYYIFSYFFYTKLFIGATVAQVVERVVS